MVKYETIRKNEVRRSMNSNGPITAATNQCRFCGNSLKHRFADLGLSPLCESNIRPDQAEKGETMFPLHAYVCEKCFLVQLFTYASPEEIFSEYAYFSSNSDTWLAHAARYCEEMKSRFGLHAGSLVVEAASNDGYLLRNFVRMGIPVSIGLLITHHAT